MSDSISIYIKMTLHCIFNNIDCQTFKKTNIFFKSFVNEKKKSECNHNHKR